MVARAYGKALSDHEIEDVYAAAWAATLSSLRKRGREMNEAELRAYVLTAVASHASKELRRRSRKPSSALELSHGEVVADRHQVLPEERAIGSEAQGIARDLLSSLPPRRRAVMLLRYGWGLSPEEVCSLVSGLSRRAYRKEVTRGVEQLIDRLKQVESGQWCASRETLLRDYVAGTADEASRRQVEQHMSHCRACSELAAQLHRQLHDMSGLVVLGTAAGFISADRASVLERLTSTLQGGRDAASAALENGESTVSAVAASGSIRGGGAAGAGIAAKFAAFGGAGKAALACLGAGAAATACVAAGVVPGVSIDGIGGGDKHPPKQVRTSAEPPRPARLAEPVEPSQPPSPPAPSPPAPKANGHHGDGRDHRESEDPADDGSADASPAEEFDPLVPAASAPPSPPPPPAPSAPAPSSGGSSSGSSAGSSTDGAIAGSEFGP